MKKTFDSTNCLYTIVLHKKTDNRKIRKNLTQYYYERLFKKKTACNRKKPKFMQNYLASSRVNKRTKGFVEKLNSYKLYEENY